MKAKTHIAISSFIFALVFILHGLRLVYSWQTEIGGWTVPMWISWVAVIITAFMVVQGFRLAK